MGENQNVVLWKSLLEETRRQKRQKKARIFPHPKQVAEDEERFFFVGV